MAEVAPRTGVLDDRSAVRRLDAAGMLAAVSDLPAQLRDGWRRTRDLTLPESHRGASGVALLGMGGSAIAGDVVRGVFVDRLRVPLVSVRDYVLPAFVGPETLVVAVSHTGATEETVSALTQALARKSPVAVIATGGPMHGVASRVGIPLLAYPGGGQPRASVGYGLSLVAGLLERAGLLDVADREIASAADAVTAVLEACGPDVPTERNGAKQLAWSLVDRFVVIQASGHLASTARRWKTQLNENAKQMAFADDLPEATHNTVVGYGQPDSLRDHYFVVFLASAMDHPRNTLRAELSMELLSSLNVAHHTVTVAGDGPLAQAVASIAYGDLVSCYLAVLYGMDPTPVDAISHIKERLSTVDGAADE